MPTRFIHTSGGNIAYDDQGEGPLVVCVPSMGDLRSEYRFLLPLLTSAGFRAVSMDVRGHGETSTSWPDYSVAAIGQDILALIESLKAGPATLIGTSMAAGASIWASVEAPDQISGMVLIGPFVHGKGDPWLKFLFSLAFARPWGPSLWAKYYARLYPTRPPHDLPEYIATLRDNLRQPGRMEALQKMMAADKTASGERLNKARVPAFILMGSLDPDFKAPEGQARWVAEQVRGSYQMVNGAGHYPHAEMPRETFERILPFLQQLENQPVETHAS